MQYSRLSSSKGVHFDSDQKSMWNFLSLIDSNLGFIVRGFW